MRNTCERLWEVDALREGRLSSVDADAHRRHAANCAECRERFAADERLAELGRALAERASDPLRARRLRRAIMRGVASPAIARRWLALPIAVATLGAAIGAGLGSSWWTVRHPEALGSPSASASSADGGAAFASAVIPSAGARWTRAREGDIERVRLEDGMLTLEVRKQRPSERFYVELPDAEIEVRGTRFDVTVGDGVTRSVRVDAGLVALRRSGSPEVMLGAGEVWSAAALAPLAAASASAEGGRRAARPAVSVASVTGEYEEAVAAYDQHDYAAASRKLAAFVRAHPGASEVEDARFLEASALAHGGQTDAASVAAERFLVRYPRSFHARDAAILAARGARDRGDCASARRLLEPWRSVSVATPDVRNALGPCAE